MDANLEGDGLEKEILGKKKKNMELECFMEKCSPQTVAGGFQAKAMVI